MNISEHPPLHPMLDLFRPLVATREIELLADAINAALDVSYRGLSVYAFARFGKSEGVTYLMDHPAWLGPRTAALKMLIMPQADKRTDGSFVSTMLTCLNVRTSPRSTPDERFKQLTSYLLECCHLAKSRLIIIFIDEAQRMKPADYEHLVTIDNQMTLLRYYVFFVFINQRDLTGYTNETVARSDYPPHVYGRFLTRKYEMCGVRCAEDAAYILESYDFKTEWPVGSGISYSAYFAKNGFKSGWRLSQHAAQLWEIACQLRVANRLSAQWTWPMKSFEGAVAYLLTTVAPRHAEFSGFTEDELQEAVIAAGYVELELSRETYLFSGEDA